MQNIYTDIYIIDKYEDNIYKSTNEIPEINNKIINNSTEKIYIKNNMILIITNKDFKNCFIIENAQYEEYEDKLLITNTLTKISNYNFPIIDQYDDIIDRTVTTYKNGIKIITDTSKKTGDITKFIRIENNNKLINDLLIGNIFI
jgi:hypothetical protein